MRRYIAFATLGCLQLMAPLATAVAQDDDLAALDAKIANLENQNATLKKRLRLEALEKENAALRKQLGIADNYQSRPDERPSIVSEQRVAAIGPVTFNSRVAASKTVASDYVRGGASRPEIPDARAAYAMKTPPNPNGPEVVLVPPPPPPVWGSFYAGASFGLGQLRSGETDNTTGNSVTTSSSFSKDSNGTIVTGQGINQTLTNGTSNASGANWGGLGALYLGFLSPIGSNFVAGPQFEGGISNIQVRQTGIGSSVSNTTSTSTTFCSICTPMNFSSTSTLGSPVTQTVSNTLSNRWFVSALARGGVIIDPSNLVYVIGGWTYAGFETSQNNAQLALQGGTIGVGWERQISQVWGIKVEYRYTKFLSKSDDLTSTNVQSSVSNQPPFATGGSTTTSFSNTSARFNAELQTVSVGISRYFSP
jgi:opacity protein-like surface antigen